MLKNQILTKMATDQPQPGRFSLGWILSNMPISFKKDDIKQAVKELCEEKSLIQENDAYIISKEKFLELNQ